MRNELPLSRECQMFLSVFWWERVSDMPCVKSHGTMNLEQGAKNDVVVASMPSTNAARCTDEGNDSQLIEV